MPLTYLIIGNASLSHHHPVRSAGWHLERTSAGKQVSQTAPRPVQTTGLLLHQPRQTHRTRRLLLPVRRWHILPRPMPNGPQQPYVAQNTGRLPNNTAGDQAADLYEPAKVR